jgi:leucyl/phenylalanyl-tRNA--protein transferase
MQPLRPWLLNGKLNQHYLKTLHILDHNLWFPPLEAATDDGLLAAGGDLSASRLLLAYRNGIFPWYEGDIPLWWSPNPRFVLYPNELRISKSMQQVINRNQFQHTKNVRFAEVIEGCSKAKRQGQAGTWITTGMVKAYQHLHEAGYAHSFEAWQHGQLVGGLYGIKMGNIFFGESMFATVSNASKAAFIWAVQQMATSGLELIDCQVYTAHLESLGAAHIDRQQFLALLHANIE